MKKLLGIVALSLLWCNFSYAEFYTFKCVKFGYYFNDEGTLETLIWDDVDDKLTVMIDDTYFEDKDGTSFFGKATLINKNWKNEYGIVDTGNGRRGFKYSLVTDDDINIRSGSLKNDMKKKRGHLYDVTFITFKKEATSDWYELNLIYTYELWMIDSAYKDNVRTMTDSYRCNLIN